MILVFRPINVWPEGWRDPNRSREFARFDSTYSSTIDLLDRELDALRAVSATLQVDARPGQIRGDGQLRADARVEHPGVILTIETKKLGTLIYSTDRFLRPGWKRNAPPDWVQNLRAIALGLEALRKIERYGIAERGQQYAGYRELGSGIPIGSEAPPSMTAEQTSLFMGAMSRLPADAILDDPDVADAAYKIAAKRCHPDVGGDPADFRKLGEARRIVALAFRR